MWNRFYDNEFEEFLKSQANQHRVYPADKAWRNIQREVHGYRKWPALTVIAVFIIAALVVGTVAVRPHTEIAAISKTNLPEIQKTQQAKLNDAAAIETKNYTEHLLIDDFTQQTIAKINEHISNDESESVLIASSYNHSSENIIAAAPEKITDNQVSITQNEKQSSIESDIDATNDFDAALHSAALPDSRFIFSTNFNLNSTSGHFSNALYKEEFPFLRSDNSNVPSVEFNSSSAAVGSPLSRIGKGSSSKLDFQFYLTPSYSYRRLVDDVQGSLSKSYVAAIPVESNYVVDLGHAIQHRPSAGYEIGFSLGYSLNKKFAVRSGFQFNVRQYNIDAFVHSAEPTTVSLSADNSNLVYNTTSGFRSIEGSKPIELKNRYYEIALPIGIDWRPINKKFAWGIAASIQPTYTFDKEPFIITSNYKNYADGSQLMRNWNINANFETYLGYNTGKYRWQIGPQFRYQLMSTMGNSFPIREYPYDIGIKLGLTRSLK
jgi:hypothetical protein